jgi:hypothetical protein
MGTFGADEQSWGYLMSKVDLGGQQRVTKIITIIITNCLKLTICFCPIKPPQKPRFLRERQLIIFNLLSLFYFNFQPPNEPVFVDNFKSNDSCDDALLTTDKPLTENGNISKSTTDFALNDVLSDFDIDKNVIIVDNVCQTTLNGTFSIDNVESTDSCDVASSTTDKPSTENADFSKSMSDFALNDAISDGTNRNLNIADGVHQTILNRTLIVVNNLSDFNEDKNVPLVDDVHQTLVDDSEDTETSKDLDTTFDVKELGAYAVNEIDNDQVSIV